MADKRRAMQHTGHIMTTTTRSRTFYGAALVCREETEQAVAIRRSTMLTHLCERIDEITTGAFDSYVEFKEWQAVIEATWATDPESYDEKVQAEIDRITAVWFEIGKALIPLMDWCEQQGQPLARGSDFRLQYAAMISIEGMDRGPMPGHMIALTERARATLDSGVGIESIGSGGL